MACDLKTNPSLADLIRESMRHPKFAPLHPGYFFPSESNAGDFDRVVAKPCAVELRLCSQNMVVTMNLTLREVPYNQALIRHLEVSLSMGGSTLGQMVAGWVSRWNARGFVLVPQNVGAPLPPFNQGGAGIEGDIFAGLAELLSSQTRSARKTIIVLHPLARRGDPLRFLPPVVPSFYKNSVVAVVEGEIASPLDVETALKVCFTAIGLATFVVPSGSLRRNGDELSNGDALCDAIETVAVGVFDNESFLICQREPD